MTPIEISLLCLACFVVGVFAGGVAYSFAIGAELESGTAKCGRRLYKVTPL